MKKIKYIWLIAVIFALFTVSAHAEDRPRYDDSTVLAVVKTGGDNLSLFSVGESLENKLLELGISEVENLDAVANGGIALMSANDEEITLKLTLAEKGEENVLGVIDALNDMDEVEYAQPNYYYYLDSALNDIYYQWGYMYNLTKINAEYVWNLDIDCSDIAVAVIDSGINMTHEDLVDNLWENPNETENGRDTDGNGYKDDLHGWDFVDNDNYPHDAYVGHGTHVAGIVGAVTGNGFGIASVARNVKIVPLRIFNSQGNTSSSIVYAALRYVRKMNIPVANCSWGGYDDDPLLKSNIKNCTNTVFTFAAGNDEIDNDSEPVYPASYGLSNTLSVASTDRYDNLSDFSNYGATSVDIAAPGTSIYSTYIGGVNRYRSMSGTSMAAPLAASVAAVVRAYYPSLTPKQVVNYILGGADTVSSLNGYVYKSRRLNAYGALNIPTPTPKPTPTPTPKPTPTPTPTPEPTPLQMADAVLFSAQNNDIKINVYFSEDYEAEDIRVFAAYKKDGELKHMECLTLDDDFSASIENDAEYADCSLTVYVWSRYNQPLYQPIIYRNEATDAE